MRRIGIKKTKWNIFLLFVAGLLVGLVLGLRQPTANETGTQSDVVVQTQEVAQ